MPSMTLHPVEFPLPESWACYAIYGEEGAGNLTPAEQEECRAYLAEYGTAPGLLDSVEEDARFLWATPAGLSAGKFVTAVVLRRGE